MAQNWSKVHQPISFGLGPNMDVHPDQHTRYTTIRICIIMHQALKLVYYDPFCLKKHYKILQDKNGSQLGWKHSSHCKNRPRVQILTFPKMEKRNLHSKTLLCLCLFQINARDQDKVVWGASNLKQQVEWFILVFYVNVSSNCAAWTGCYCVVGEWSMLVASNLVRVARKLYFTMVERLRLQCFALPRAAVRWILQLRWTVLAW